MSKLRQILLLYRGGWREVRGQLFLTRVDLHKQTLVSCCKGGGRTRKVSRCEEVAAQKLKYFITGE